MEYFSLFMISIIIHSFLESDNSENNKHPPGTGLWKEGVFEPDTKIRAQNTKISEIKKSRTQLIWKIVHVAQKPDSLAS